MMHLAYQGMVTTSWPTSNKYAIVEYKPLPYSTRKSPRNGRLSISAETYIKEESNPHYKSAMEYARAALIEDYQEVSPNNLSKLRLKKGMSQTSLASVIGTSQSHVAKIEAGLLDVKFSTATKIADALAVSMDELRPLITMSKTEIHEIKTMVTGS
ncbi:MAG: helix-turn-helix transcriptional regulator [Methylotenera sp.]|nr:helix-turn-helix transcriptional regulator [Methylotenera sp.]